MISGQWWRAYSTYPSELQTPKQLGPRRCLPDHDQMAVDGNATADNPSHLYPNKRAFNAQFDLRKRAAERHVRAIFRTWCANHGRAIQ